MALYRGLTPSLLGILPYAGFAFATFETLKQVCVCGSRVARRRAHPVYCRETASYRATALGTHPPAWNALCMAVWQGLLDSAVRGGVC